MTYQEYIAAIAAATELSVEAVEKLMRIIIQFDNYVGESAAYSSTSPSYDAGFRDGVAQALKTLGASNYQVMAAVTRRGLEAK